MQALLGAFVFIAEALPARAQCEPAIELISDRTQFPTRAAHAVAFTGSVIGLVKLQPPSGPLYFATYDLDFNPLSGDQKVADTFIERTIDVFWTGSEFALFYESTSTELVLQRIDRSGTPIGGSIVIPLRVGLSNAEFDVEYDPTSGMYIVAHAVPRTSDAGLWVTYVNTDGTVAREQRVAFFVSLEANPRVAIAGDGTIGVLYRHGIDGTQRLLRVVSTTGTQQPETFVPTSSGGREPFLAASDNEFAMIHRLVTTTASVLNWTKVGTDGEITLSETRLFNAVGIDVAAVDFQWNDKLGEWVLTYATSLSGFSSDPGMYRILRFRSDEDLIDDALFSPDPLRSSYLGRNNFIWTGTGYVSPADRAIAPSVTESYLLRYCPFQVLAESDRRNASIGAPVSFSATASGGTAPYEYEWQLGDGSRQLGQFVQRIYTTPGVYTAIVTATDADGEVVTNSVTFTVFQPRQRAVRK